MRNILFLLGVITSSILNGQNIVWNSTCIGKSNCKYILKKNNMNNKSVPDQWSEIINYIYPLSNTKGSNGSIYSNAYNSPDYFDEKCISNDVLNIDNTWWSVAPGNNRRDGFTAMLSYSNYEEGVVFQLKENLVPGEYYRLKLVCRIKITYPIQKKIFMI